MMHTLVVSFSAIFVGEVDVAKDEEGTRRADDAHPMALNATEDTIRVQSMQQWGERGRLKSNPRNPEGVSSHKAVAQHESLQCSSTGQDQLTNSSTQWLAPTETMK